LTVYNEEFRFSELEQSSEARMGSEEDSIKPMEEQEEESVSDAKVLPFEESQHQMAKPKQQLLKEEPVQANPLKEKKAEPKPTKQAVKPRVEEAKPARAATEQTAPAKRCRKCHGSGTGPNGTDRR
jgi:hypothetical protein